MLHIIVNGFFLPTKTLTDLSGNYDSSTYKRFPTIGSFNYAIPTSDGGYLAVGWTAISSTFNVVSGKIQSLSPIYYNPDAIHMKVSFQQSSNGGSCATCSPVVGVGQWKTKGLAVKYDSLLHVVWSYTYGTVPYVAGSSNAAFYEGGQINHAVECSGGGYIRAGSSGVSGAWYKKINANGMIKEEYTVFTPASGTGVNAMVKTIEAGAEVYYLAGNDDTNNRVYISKVNASGTILWTVYRDPSGQHDDLNSLDLSMDGNLYISRLSSTNNSNPALANYGFIYKINSSTQSDIYSYIETIQTQADDKSYHLTATSDGGCAIVSTVLRTPLSCSINLPQNYLDTGGSPYTTVLCNISGAL